MAIIIIPKINLCYKLWYRQSFKQKRKKCVFKALRFQNPIIVLYHALWRNDVPDFLGVGALGLSIGMSRPLTLNSFLKNALNFFMYFFFFFKEHQTSHLN